MFLAAALCNHERLKSTKQEYNSRTVLQTISFSVLDELQRSLRYFSYAGYLPREVFLNSNDITYFYMNVPISTNSSKFQ